MNPLIPVVVMALLAGGIVALFILASVFLGPRKRNAVKDSPFECGLPSEGWTPGQTPVHFYLTAMLFIVFDIELAFFFPWAVAFRSLGPMAFWEMLGFAVVIGVGYVYAWKSGALKWE